MACSYLKDYTAKRYRKSTALPSVLSVGKFTLWVIRSYLKGGIKHLGHIPTRVMSALREYERQRSSLDKEERDINRFCGLVGCTGKWGEYVPGLEDVIFRESKEARIVMSPVYVDGACKVYIPKTMKESCHIGKGTKWCTASTISDNKFDTYNSSGELYVIVPVSGRRKYQLHLELKEFMDDSNDIIGISECFQMHLILSLKIEILV
jgi:hypothetical protein